MPNKKHKSGPYYKQALRAIVQSAASRQTRISYSVGAILGALQAKNCGYQKVVLIEFGVAEGGGFKALMKMGELIQRHLSIEVKVIGFDNRDGLPEPQGYRDHPEIWSHQQFAMGLNYDSLDKRAKDNNAELVIGDISDTLKNYNLNDSVLVFCSVDVDYYSSTKPIMKWLSELPDINILPATPIYFDDVLNNWTYSEFAGEALAIKEFNDSHPSRKIELKDSTLTLYAYHSFSHPLRTGEEKTNIPLEIFVDDMKRFFWR